MSSSAEQSSVDMNPRAIAVRFLGDPNLVLAGLVVCLTIVLRWAFLRESAWVWGFASHIDLDQITPWARWAMSDRDGAEPYVLMALVGVLSTLTALGALALRTLGPVQRAAVGAALLALSVCFALRVPLSPPMSAVALDDTPAFIVVASSLLGALLLHRALSRRRRVPYGLLLVLLPVCFIRIALPRASDLICILAPALRLEHGVPPSQIYMQYDLLHRSWCLPGGRSAALP